MVGCENTYVELRFPPFFARGRGTIVKRVSEPGVEHTAHRRGSSRRNGMTTAQKACLIGVIGLAFGPVLTSVAGATPTPPSPSSTPAPPSPTATPGQSQINAAEAQVITVEHQ